MRWTVWWLRGVGGLYGVLAAANLVFLVASPDFFRSTIPYAADDIAVRTFMDAWLVFVLELLALGIAMIVASFRAAEARPLIWAILGAELLRGIVADVVWLAQGYAATTYVPFIVLHAVVIATGIVALRRDSGRYATADSPVADSSSSR